MNLIKKLTQVLTIVFTLLIVVQMLAGVAMDNKILWQLLLISLVSAVIKVIFFKDSLFHYHWLYQLGYLGLVWLSIILFGLLYNWKVSLGSSISNLMLVGVIYVVIRIINYRKDQIEVAEMNDILRKRRIDREDNLNKDKDSH